MRNIVYRNAMSVKFYLKEPNLPRPGTDARGVRILIPRRRHVKQRVPPTLELGTMQPRSQDFFRGRNKLARTRCTAKNKKNLNTSKIAFCTRFVINLIFSLFP